VGSTPTRVISKGNDLAPAQFGRGFVIVPKLCPTETDRAFGGAAAYPPRSTMYCSILPSRRTIIVRLSTTPPARNTYDRIVIPPRSD
jgi:hypothetical protein